MKIGIDMELEQYPKSISVNSNDIDIDDEIPISNDTVRNLILTAYNNSVNYPDEAIANLLDAMLEINELKIRKKIYGKSNID